MYRIFLFFALLLPVFCLAQNKQETEIRRILAAQTGAWNRADITGFMDGYWQSDSLTFIGKSGLNKGWQRTLDNYKKSYPTPELMGKLDFTILKVAFLDSKTAYVIGKWHLARTLTTLQPENLTADKKIPQNNDLQGHFTLVWKKIKGKWVIISDHSS
jgi:ketosteroid isomerase-like protein